MVELSGDVTKMQATNSTSVSTAVSGSDLLNTLEAEDIRSGVSDTRISSEQGPGRMPNPSAPYCYRFLRS